MILLTNSIPRPRKVLFRGCDGRNHWRHSWLLSWHRQLGHTGSGTVYRGRADSGRAQRRGRRRYSWRNRWRTDRDGDSRVRGQALRGQNSRGQHPDIRSRRELRRVSRAKDAFKKAGAADISYTGEESVTGDPRGASYDTSGRRSTQPYASEPYTSYEPGFREEFTSTYGHTGRAYEDMNPLIGTSIHWPQSRATAIVIGKLSSRRQSAAGLRTGAAVGRSLRMRSDGRGRECLAAVHQIARH